MTIRPARILLVAVFGTQMVATLIAVYGLLWGYSLAWFFVNDRVKLLAYRIFDPVKTKTPLGITPQIAKGAYELYEQQSRREGHAAQDWLQAERNVREDESHN
jgi:H+-transporting ATPase